MAVGVMLVDDHPHFRRAMREMISQMPGFDVVSECESGEASLGQVASTRPSLVLMDVRMPGMGGVAAAREIRNQHPDTVVVLVSAEEADSCLPEDARAPGVLEFARKQDLRPRFLSDLWARYRRG
jgi:two-component system nitrate/nitrite response regulator NarL